MAFNDWLSSRGFKPQSPRKQPEVSSSKKSKSSVDSSEKAAKAVDASRESLLKANSRRRQTVASSPVPEEVILQELPRRHTVSECLPAHAEHWNSRVFFTVVLCKVNVVRKSSRFRLWKSSREYISCFPVRQDCFCVFLCCDAALKVFTLKPPPFVLFQMVLFSDWYGEVRFCLKYTFWSLTIKLGILCKVTESPTCTYMYITLDKTIYIFLCVIVGRRPSR